MVTTNLPVVAVLVAERVIVLEVVAGCGLKTAVTPLGNPDADKVTLPLNPPCGVIAIVDAPDPPCVIMTVLGEAESVKLCPPDPLIVKVTVTFAVRLPEVPVTVIG